MKSIRVPLMGVRSASSPTRLRGQAAALPADGRRPPTQARQAGLRTVRVLLDPRGQHADAPDLRGDRRREIYKTYRIYEKALAVSGFTALVLAGSRGGVDPVAAYAGVSHKGLIELGGETLLARVLRRAATAPARRGSRVSTNDEASWPASSPGGASGSCAAADEPEPERRARAPRRWARRCWSPPCDHALLQPEWVLQFIGRRARRRRHRRPAGAGGAWCRRPRRTTQRTYLKFRDGRYSGCNLFLPARRQRALAAIDLWRRVEAHRKQPLADRAAARAQRCCWATCAGPLTLDERRRAVGRKAGVKAAAVRTPYGLAAVDVDKPRRPGPGANAS